MSSRYRLVRTDIADPNQEEALFADDRLGHDRNYAIDPSNAERELRWKPSMTLNTGLVHTVRWYTDHRVWSECVQSGAYKE